MFTSILPETQRKIMRDTDHRFVQVQEDAAAEMELLDNVKEGLGYLEKQIAKQNHKIEVFNSYFNQGSKANGTPGR